MRPPSAPCARARACEALHPCISSSGEHEAPAAVMQPSEGERAAARARDAAPGNRPVREAKGRRAARQHFGETEDLRVAGRAERAAPCVSLANNRDKRAFFEQLQVPELREPDFATGR